MKRASKAKQPREKSVILPVKLGTTESDFDAYYASPINFASTARVLETGYRKGSDSPSDLPILEALERKWAPNRQRKARKVVGSTKARNSEAVSESERKEVFVGDGWLDLVGYETAGQNGAVEKGMLFEGQPMAGLLHSSLLQAGISPNQLRLPTNPQPCPFKCETGCKYLDDWQKDKNYPRHAISHLKGLGYYYRCPEDGNLCLRPDNFLRHSWSCRGAWILGRKRMCEIYRKNLYVVWVFFSFALIEEELMRFVLV